MGLCRQALSDEGFADFVNWRWLAQFRVLSLGSGLKIDEAKIEVEQPSPGTVVLLLWAHPGQTFVGYNFYIYRSVAEVHNHSMREIR